MSKKTRRRRVTGPGHGFSPDLGALDYRIAWAADLETLTVSLATVVGGPNDGSKGLMIDDDLQQTSIFIALSPGYMLDLSDAAHLLFHQAKGTTQCSEDEDAYEDADEDADDDS